MKGHPMKPEIYNSLAAINQATEQIAENIKTLKDARVLTPHYAELRILAARQNCAEINGSAVNHLVKPEMDKAARLEKERVAKETKLKTS
jgi:hypothetical protein